MRAQVISELLARLAGAGPDAAVAEFWEGRRTPVIERVPGAPGERLVTFLWRDAEAEGVVITINRITNSAEEGMLERVEDTDVWFRSFRLGADWRGTYSIMALDAKGLAALRDHEPRWAMRTIRERGALDPLNPLRVATHGGYASLAELPDATSFPWFDREPLTRGQVSEHRLGNGRRVWVYRPAGVAQIIRRPLVVMMDGEIWHRSGDATHAIDVLAEANTIRTPYLVLVDAEGSRRLDDLSIDGGMSEEVVSVILPWARSQLSVSTDPADVIVSGESLGGLTALKTVFDHPHIAGSAIAQSSSLWQHDMLERSASAPPVRLFLTAGRHETQLTDANRILAAVLNRSHHDFRYTEYNGGHDMAWWRGLWAVGVQHLLAR